jgi:hypothetical protein
MNKLHNLNSRAARALTVLVVALIGVVYAQSTYAATGSLSFSPSSSSVTVGNELVLTMDENSGTDAAIGVDAFVNYSSNLQFVSATTVSPFSVSTPDTASGGTVEITRGAYSGQTGNQVVSVITFNTLSTGTATVTFNASKSSIASASSSANLLVNSPGGSYTLSAPVSTPPVTTPPVTTPPAPVDTTITPSTTKPASNASSVRVAPQSSASSSDAITVPDNSAVAISTPVSVEPATVQPSGVKMVQYYLDNKLVDTETKAPYKFNVKTSKLKNGTYNLTSKTTYTNGTVKQSIQHLVIRNAAAHQSFDWLYILLLAVVILVIVAISLDLVHPFNRSSKIGGLQNQPVFEPPVSTIVQPTTTAPQPPSSEQVVTQPPQQSASHEEPPVAPIQPNTNRPVSPGSSNSNVSHPPTGQTSPGMTITPTNSNPQNETTQPAPPSSRPLENNFPKDNEGEDQQV